MRQWRRARWGWHYQKRTQNGRIIDNWHIEDNLTLLQQMGVAKVAS
ncbi:ester cyclase [Bradyrhizobium erythrophlei]|nr:ester cyclase [Bradyrhizobium erythrophlei]